MMRKFNTITQRHVRSLFDYCETDGLLVWKTCLSNRAPVGSRVETINIGDGYREVQIHGQSYRAHRLIWVFHHGEIPEGLEVDHKDRDRSNDRIWNLRLATPSQNNFNQPCRNKFKLKGVKRNGKKFQAVITKDGKTLCLGSYETPERAHEVYMAKAIEIVGEFASRH